MVILQCGIFVQRYLTGLGQRSFLVRERKTLNEQS